MLSVLILALPGSTVNGAAGGLAPGENSSSAKVDPAVAPPETGGAFFTPPAGARSLATAAASIRDDVHALALVDARLYELIGPALDDYLAAAARRRQFGIGLLPILDLDDRRPEEVRAALQSWHAAKPELEGVLFVGNIKLPSYARTLPWMDEGWQSSEILVRDMAQACRRVVWWNVHSNPELSLVSWEQARDLRNGGLIALLNGCSVGGFAQPGSRTVVDTPVTAERNVLVNLVYGQSAFVAAMGSVHDRVTDERATPLLRHLYAGGYLGRAHLLRLRQQDRDVQSNPALLREFQEILIGDPFADAK